jgi:hypothetical protein
MLDDSLEVAEHAVVAIRNGIKAIHCIWARQVQTFFSDFGILEVEKALSFIAEILSDRCHNISVFNYNVQFFNRRGSRRHDCAREDAGPVKRRRPEYYRLQDSRATSNYGPFEVFHCLLKGINRARAAIPLNEVALC